MAEAYSVLNFSRLGLRYIAEGTDRRLFLLVLVLPAPIVACGRQRDPPACVRRSLVCTLGFMTTFIIGHSITLSLAALNAVTIPSRPVEVLMAASVPVPAVNDTPRAGKRIPEPRPMQARDAGCIIAIPQVGGGIIATSVALPERRRDRITSPCPLISTVYLNACVPALNPSENQDRGRS